jgi:hypothetical protein
VEAERALDPEPANPLVRRCPADALGLGGRRRRPTKDRDPGHQQLTAEDVETGLTMGHESLPAVWCFDNTSHRGRRLSIVNNVFADYN